MSEKSIIKRDYDELVKSKINSVIILTVKFGILIIMDEYTRNQIKWQEIKIADFKIQDVRMDIRREDIRNDIRIEETRRDDIRREEIIRGFKKYPSSTMMTTRQQTPTSHPFAVVPEQILTKSCILNME